MAKSVKPDTAGQAGINPNDLNPLIESNYLDTLGHVNAALDFLAGWAENCNGELDAFPLVRGGEGLAMILQTINAAIKYHINHDGGAK